MTKRHHAAHPPTAIKPNADVNHKPESYVGPAKPVEAAQAPLSTPALDTVNSRTETGLAADPAGYAAEQKPRFHHS